MSENNSPSGSSYLHKHRDKIFYVLLAELSLITMTLTVVTSGPIVVSSPIPRIVFILINILGIIAGVSPSTLSLGKSERTDGDGVKGHHPDCNRFKDHTVKLFGSPRCAGCTGLVIGALVSLIGLISKFSPYLVAGETVFWAGVLFVSLGIVQHFIDLNNGWVHLSLNISLVIGSWFMFDSITSLRLGFYVQTYFLSVTLFWIWVRIRASQFTHVEVCSMCNDQCVHVFS